MTSPGVEARLAGRAILLGVTGSIAAYKAAFLARLLMEAGGEVQVVMTQSATRFVGPDTFAALTRRPVHSDVFERTDHVCTWPWPAMPSWPWWRRQRPTSWPGSPLGWPMTS